MRSARLSHSPSDGASIKDDEQHKRYLSFMLSRGSGEAVSIEGCPVVWPGLSLRSLRSPNSPWRVWQLASDGSDDLLHEEHSSFWCLPRRFPFGWYSVMIFSRWMRGSYEVPIPSNMAPITETLRQVELKPDGESSGIRIPTGPPEAMAGLRLIVAVVGPKV